MADSANDPTPVYSFEEYRMYYESAERVSEQRQSVNERNRSLCTSLAVAVAIAFSWAAGNAQYRYVALVCISLVSLLAIVYSGYWAARIKSLKLLNAKKFEVLHDMAPYVVFDPASGSRQVLYDTFDKEWKKIDTSGGLQDKPRFGFRAQKDTDAEFGEITAVRVLFLCFLVLAIAPIVVQPGQALESFKAFIGL